VRRENDTKEKLLTTALELIWENSYGSISVDDICSRARVNKGSFYYAFKSKSDLAAAAAEDHWNKKRVLMDGLFSPQTPPLERLEKYCGRLVQDQTAKFQKFGKMCGCPFASIGSELSTQDEQIRRKAHELSERTMKYLSSALRDANADGSLVVENPAETARQIFCYANGLIAQAKIENDPGVLKCLKDGVFRLVGASPAGAPA
jgi:TetR/AcrR family transcriptional regulator, transcriptional repressor for nem operon